jgi:hypothetical protein
LPAGIFAKTTHDRSSPDGDERTPTNHTDPFLLPTQVTLPARQPPSSLLTIDTDISTHRRTSSDSFSSQLTDDEDDKTSSLHVLTDEQLEHLASVYHPLPASIGTMKTSTVPLSESLLQSLSHPFSKLLQR